jgi:hypothetical protein
MGVGTNMEVETSILTQLESIIIHVSTITNLFATLEDVGLNVKVRLT